MSDDWRLTETQVSTGAELHAKLLPNWRFADRAFAFLKERQFESEEVCLLAVVAVDALYSTNLRYVPGRREAVARHIFRIRARLLQSDGFEPGLVEEIAEHGADTASVSFASKFCHFFVSDGFPIFDSFVRLALKKLVSPRERRRLGIIGLEHYSEFCKMCHLMTTLRGVEARTISVRQLDQCLWLMGQYIAHLKEADRFADDLPEGSRNEVRTLIQRYPQRFQQLLPDHLRPERR